MKTNSAYSLIWRKKSLGAILLVATCVGMLAPAMIGGLMVNRLSLERAIDELNQGLDAKAALLADSLKNPVWNYDIRAAEAIVNSAMLDPQISRITIVISRNVQEEFLTAENRERRVGQGNRISHDLTLDGERMGTVEIEQYDGLALAKFRREQLSYGLILLGQCIFAFFLVLASVHHWVLSPLRRLTAFSNQLAGGDLETSLTMRKSDEIGQLARQMNQMRINLRKSFSEQEMILSNVQVGVVFIQDKTIRLANLRFEQIFGYSEGEMVGLSIEPLFLSSIQLADTCDGLIQAARGHMSYEKELPLKHHGGFEFWAEIRGCMLDSGDPDAGSLWAIADISLRKAAEAELNTLAFYDQLTNLANRRLLLDRLNQAIASVHRSQRRCALLFIDLDNFKDINDTLGHDIGDRLLVQAANRLKNCVRENDTIARVGGDEFVVLLDSLSQDQQDAADQARIVAEKIIEVLSHPYRIYFHDCHSSTSVGITLFDAAVKRETGIDDLFKQADLALYQAKNAGRKTYRFFDRGMQAAAAERATLEKDLRNALCEDEFTLFYQMQVDCYGRLRGAEALIRWQHPQRGLLFPGEFIPMAEDSGLIVEIGYWVIGAACRQLKAWEREDNTKSLTISVNVSAKQLHDKNFIEKVLTCVAENHIDSTHLKLELTESLLIENAESIIEKMTALQKKGLRFSLDDFGTGYSSLSYLKRLPLCELKIDRLFITQLFDDADDVAIAKMIIALGASLGLTVIAEGVETEEQRDFLAGIGCYQYQGYYFDRPLPIAEFESRIASWTEFVAKKKPHNHEISPGINLASLKVGEPSIDDEHDRLLSQLHQLRRSSVAILDEQKYFNLINDIWCLLSVHFEHEEAYFKSLDMPEAEVRRHIRSHRQISRQFASLITDLTKDFTTERDQFTSKIEDWILVHLIQHDTKLKAYIPRSI